MQILGGHTTKESQGPKKAEIYIKASRHNVESSLFNSWSLEVGRGHN
jgi:hypothetical protein